MNQMLKKASSVFTAIVCAASITFSGASLVLADGEIDEQTKTTIETTAEGLTNTIIPLTEDEIAAYMESGDAFTENAMTAWDSAREELGDLKKAGSAEIEYSNDEYTATVPVEFEKEDAEFIYVFDKNLTPTSLSVDVKYSFATTMKNAALNTIMGLGTVFVILIMLIFLISLFQFIPGSGAQEAKAKKKAAEEAASAPTPAPVAAAVEETGSVSAPTAAPVAAPKAAPAAAPKAAAPAAGAGAVKVSASVPGKVLKVVASVGQAVKAGDNIIILESMKMEIPVVAPQDGTVASIDTSEGASVENGDTLATMN